MDRLMALADRSPFIGEVRGRGLLLYPAGWDGQVLRVIPPLTVTADELDAGLTILEETVQHLAA
jgi:4-aminobutyrate aminotransferase-like enzyme